MPTNPTLPIPGADQTYGVAVALVNGHAYVTDEEAPAVWVIDTATDSIVTAPGLVPGDNNVDFSYPRVIAAQPAPTTTTTTTTTTTIAPTTLPPPVVLPPTGSSTTLSLIAFAFLALGVGAVVATTRR